MNPRFQEISSVGRKKHSKHTRPITYLPNNRSDDCLGRIHVNVVELWGILPSAMNDFGSNGVAGFDLIEKLLLICGVVRKEVRYAVPQALADALSFIF